ncbi:MAG: SSS family solute:Na+ symporter [Halieaceae bacterium]|jgi:SSS family solute:Na+ symporter
MDTLAITTFLAFTILVLLLSFWITRNDNLASSEGYFLAGRSLGAWVIAGSLILTNLSTEHLIGLNGDAFNHTVAVMAWETTAALAMVLTAVYFLPRYLKLGLTTIPEFLALRFDTQTRVFASTIFLFSYVAAILPIVLLFGATGLESLFDLSEATGWTRKETLSATVWVVGVLGATYAVIGGLKTVAIADTINGVGFLVAGLLIPYLALSMLGDGNAIAGFKEVFEAEHEKFDITGDEPGSFLPFGVLFTGMIINQVFFWCTNQSIVQRALAAKNLKEGQKGVLIAAVFKLIGPLIIVLPGVIAYHMFKDQITPENYLLAYPTLVKTVLPSPMIGFFAAVMVGAVLSTFNSVLNSSATLFSQGIYHTCINKHATDRQLVRAGRTCSIVLALGAMTVAPFVDTSGSLYAYLQKINATFFGPMLAVILLGMLTTRVSALAAKAALVLGPCLFYLLVFVGGDTLQNILKASFGLADGLHFLHMLAIVFTLTVILMLTISHCRPATNVFKFEASGAVDLTPWRWTSTAATAICVATVMVYIALAQ